MIVLALRELSNALIERKREVHRLALIAANITTPVSQRLLKIFEINAFDNDGDEDDKAAALFLRLRNMPERKIPVLSGDFLCAVTGERHASNIEYEIKNILKLSQSEDETDTNTAEPNLDGWSDHEIQTIERSYHRRIHKMTEQLRDVHTETKYMLDNNGVYITRRGDLFTEPFKGRVPMLSFDCLNGWVPDNILTSVLDTVHAIQEIAAPLPGEPPTLDSKSSNTNNAIKLDLPRILDTENGLPSLG